MSELPFLSDPTPRKQLAIYDPRPTPLNEIAPLVAAWVVEDMRDDPSRFDKARPECAHLSASPRWPDRKRTTVLRNAPPDLVRAFTGTAPDYKDGWASRVLGLVEIYGDPERGYAEGVGT